MLALAAAVALPIGLMSVTAASAAPGFTDTTHFSSVQSWGSPTGTPTNNSSCTGATGAILLNDFTFVNATGNGVQHLNVNGAQDGWFTTTFTGTGTVTFWSPDSLDVTYDNGNIVNVVVHDGATPDLQVSGHLTQWFGFEGNKQNQLGHGTVNFQGVTVADSPAPVSFHNDVHFAWLPGSDPTGAPDFYFNKVSC